MKIDIVQDLSKGLSGRYVEITSLPVENFGILVQPKTLLYGDCVEKVLMNIPNARELHRQLGELLAGL